MADRIKATRADWEISDMPAEQETFTIKRKFTAEGMNKLSFGHIPSEMEDRWFSYMENNRLFIHRSWSGNCIFILTFPRHGKKIKVTVNRDQNQYACTDVEEDKTELNSLLDWWC